MKSFSFADETIFSKSPTFISADLRMLLAVIILLLSHGIGFDLFPKGTLN